MIIATQQLHGNHWNVPNLHLLLLWLVGDVALVVNKAEDKIYLQ